MSDSPIKAPEASAAPLASDELKNLKAEMNRKIENQNAQIQSLLAELQKSRVPSPASVPASKPVSVFEDEEAYARRIKEETSRELEAKFEAKQQAQAKYQSVISKIIQEYPEASDESSALMIRAKELYSNYGDDERMSPITMKAAITEAASELGIKPKSKRAPAEHESFVMGSSGSSSRGVTSKRAADLEKSLEFADKLGLDEKFKERIKARILNK